MADTGLKREDQIDERQSDMFNPHSSGQEVGDGGKSNSHADLQNIENSYVQAGIDQTEAHINDPKNWTTSSSAAAVKSQEESQEENPLNYQNSGEGKSFFKKIGNRKSATIALISMLGISGGLLASFLGPASMLVNIMENAVIQNDTSTPSMERRFFKAFTRMTQPTAPTCSSTKSYMKCKRGRISNNALRVMEKRAGITAVFGNGNTGTKKRLGYPKSNPTHYLVDMGDGKAPKRIKAEDFSGFLAQKENKKIAFKIMGIGGTFNLRFKAWSSKYLAKKFYKKFGITKSGGIANKSGNKLSTKAADIRKKVMSKIPALDKNKITGASTTVNSKMESKLKYAKKGGPVYLTSVATCVAPKAPRYFAAAVAAIQLAQIMPIINDFVLSPGGKLKASADGSGFSPEDMHTAGSILTEQTPRDGDGKMTSALDSPYLLAAIGVNKSPPPVSKKFTPGFSVIASPIVRKSTAAEKKMAPACNKILSPEAMYTAMAADAAVTVAASSTIIGGIIKIAAGWAVSEVAAKLVEGAIRSYGTKILNEVAKNDFIPEARGQALGDVLGISAAAFFSSGSMSRHLPTLKQSQVATFSSIMKENEDYNRELAIASLSPFDMSSRYTFAGSMVNGLRLQVAAGNLSTPTNILSSIGNGLNSVLFGNVKAVDESSMEKYCNYADKFGISKDSNGEVPAINMAGLPCTGITREQVNMSAEMVDRLILNEEWVDDSKDLPDNADIEDMIETGFIKKDTPLYDYIDQCSDSSTGDYLFNGENCSFSGNATSGGWGGDGNCETDSDEDGNEIKYCAKDEAPESTVKGVKDPRSLSAIVPFLLDHQIMQSVNGEDEEEYSQSTEGGNTEGGSDIRVASYNILGAHHTDPGKPRHGKYPVWDIRIKKVTENITSKNIDVIGFQELEPRQQEYLDNNLPGYKRSTHGKKDDGIMWNSNKFTMTDKGTWETKYFHGPIKEPWVKLKDNSTNQEFYVMNVHDPINSGNTGSEYTRFNNAKAHLAEIDKLKPQAPVILTGDFNNGFTKDQGAKMSSHDRTIYCVMTSNGDMEHAYDVFSKREKKCPNPTPSGADIKSHVDHVFVSPGLEVSKYWSIRHLNSGERWNPEGNHSGSDHPAVIADVVIPVTGGGSPRGWSWPVDRKWWTMNKADFLDEHKGAGTFTSPGTKHIAVDISSVNDGEPVYAMVGGKVVKRPLGRGSYICSGKPNSNHNGGLMIESEIQGGKLLIAYAHGYNVTDKAAVAAGDRIMDLGNVGNSCGAHLHLDMSFNNKNICPQDIFLVLGADKEVDLTNLHSKTLGGCGR